MSKWYIEILASDRGTVSTTLSPTTFSISKSVNQKERFRATIPYDASVVSNKYFYLKNDRDDAAWFYGIIQEVTKNYTSSKGQTVSIEGVCNFHDLSKISVDNLGIFTSGIGDPLEVRRIVTAGSRSDTGFPTDPEDVAIPALIDNDTGTTYAWDMWTGDGNPKGKGMDAIYIASPVPIYDAIFIMANGTSFTSPESKDLIFQYLGQSATDGEGWTGTGVSIGGTTATVSDFQGGAATVTVSIDSDLAGDIVKSSQSGLNAFWYRLWVSSAEVQSRGQMILEDIRINKRVSVTDAITRLMTLAPGWTADNLTTSTSVYHEFVGETFIEALRLLAKMTGGFFVNGSTSSSNIIDWNPSSDSNLVAKESASWTFDEDNIIDLVERDIKPTATRYTLYGAGHGQARITAQLQEGPESFTIDGDSYTYNPITNQIVNDTAETELGEIIHKELNVPYVSALYSSGQSPEASNMLIRFGKTRLPKASRRNRKAYTVKVGNLTADIPVGQCVRLTLDHGAIDVDEAFIITSATLAYSNVSTMTYELSSDGYYLDTLNGEEQDRISETQDATRYRQLMWIGDIEGGKWVLDDGSGGQDLDIDLDEKPFFGTVCVPTVAFANPYAPTTAEFETWLATGTNDRGNGVRYEYTHPGTGDSSDPDGIWLSDGDGTATEIFLRDI